MATKREVESVPQAVRKYAESMGLELDDPHVQKYAQGMKGRKADDEIILSATHARPVWLRSAEEGVGQPASE